MARVHLQEGYKALVGLIVLSKGEDIEDETFVYHDLGIAGKDKE